MTRLHRLAAHPRRTLGALAVVLAAVGITVGSGANFTASAANPGNAFTTGTLVDRQLAEHGALSVERHEAGRQRHRHRRHHEHRHRSPATSRSRPPTPTGATALLGQLRARSSLDCGAWTGHRARTARPARRSVYNGKVSALTNAALGNYAGGIKHRYQFTATLPGDHQRHVPGQVGRLDFAWSATQS